MTAMAQTWRKVTRKGQPDEVVSAPVEAAAVETATVETPAVEIAPNDPLIAYLQGTGGAVEVDRLELASPGVTALREAGVALVVPLISGGELIGTLNLGPRLSDQQYSTDDKRLLDGLAAQAAPALQVAVVIGDVTDKGVPAAMVMAAARSLLRASGQRVISPGEVLERVNDLLCPDIPENMFVTCLYAVVDPATGHIVYANAGHNLPYARTATGSLELRATGMPLGLLPGMNYEEREATLTPGDELLLYSDGVTEAHGAEREMFGTPRLVEHVANPESGDLIDGLLTSLQRFTGEDWEQEDDITLVTLRRTGLAGATNAAPADLDLSFSLPSVPGNEREAMNRVVEAVTPLGLEPRKLDRLGTAVSEAAMNAIEHGNQAQAEVPVEVEVHAHGGRLSVLIRDVGAGSLDAVIEHPDLEAKLEGLQKPRGWGLFLIENMVDEINVTDMDGHHTVELVVNLEGGGDQ